MTELSWSLVLSLCCIESEVAQLCPTLCDPVDCSLPGSSIHGILQARILEWVTISFSRGSSQPRDQTWVSRIGGRCFNLWTSWSIILFSSCNAWEYVFIFWPLADSYWKNSEQKFTLFVWVSIYPDEWTKMWHIFITEYYSAIKKNEIMSFAATWLDLEIIILKWSKSDKDKYHITYMWNLKQTQTHRHRKQIYGYQRGRLGEG